MAVRLLLWVALALLLVALTLLLWVALTLRRMLLLTGVFTT
jgi:hypothetical protein